MDPERDDGWKEQSDLPNDSTVARVKRRHAPILFARGEVLAERFRVIRFLARGGMGEVYEAEDLELGERIALKTVRTEIASDVSMMDRFRREVQLARKVTNPHVCRIFDVFYHHGKSGKSIFLTMELLEGESLSKRLRENKKLTIDKALPLVQQMTAGLSAAHNAGIIHGDFKSSNVMLIAPQSPGQTERVVITDFGLARMSTGTTHVQKAEDNIEGTPAYLSPEQIEGHHVTQASDIYALGVVLYEMVTGELPFCGETPESVAKNRLSRQPDPPQIHEPAIDSRWQKGILRCLQRNPADRFSKADDVAHYLSHQSKFRPLIAVAILLLALFGYLYWMQSVETTSVSSVAVLPFKNIGLAQNEDQFLVDGISEHLIARLTRLNGIRVIPWRTVQQYKASVKSPREIAKEMSVDAVVTGSVKKQNRRLHVQFALTDLKTGLTKWSDQIEGDTHEIFSIQEQVLIRTAKKLRGKLTDDEKNQLARNPSTSVEAYEYYLRGNAARWKGRETTRIAFDFYRKSLSLDPNLAEAYAGMGSVYYSQYYNGWADGSALNKAENYLLRAMQLDPRLPRSYFELFRLYRVQGKTEATLKATKKLRYLAHPDPESVLALAFAYNMVGMYEKAIPLWKKVIDLDPANTAAYYYLSTAYMFTGKYDEALRAIKGNLIVNEFQTSSGFRGKGVVQLCQGKTKEAENDLNRALEISSDDWVSYSKLGVIHSNQGRMPDAIEDWNRGLSIVNEMLENSPKNLRLRRWRGFFLASLGQREDALREEQFVLNAEPDNGFLIYSLAVNRAALGDAYGASALMLRSVRTGYMESEPMITCMYLGFENVQKTPDYKQYLAENDVLINRLRSLY